MSANLNGLRIWLAGSIPNDGDVDAPQRVRAFVAALAAAVFRAGGHLVHGSHPSLIPALLEAASRYRQETGRPAGLTLGVSRFFASEPAYATDLPAWRQEARVVEVPIVAADTELEMRERSLERLRVWLAGRCDAMVVAGGKWWRQAPHLAGLPTELSLALQRGLPVFLAAGLGGAAAGFLAAHPEILRHLRNGLEENANAELARLSAIDPLVARILDQLARLPLVTRPGRAAPFRILALDGGGIRGTYTAAVLAKLQQLTGQPIVKHFDLIAGTSTGGILAIGLGLGKEPEELLDLYQKRGRLIFPMTGRWQRLWRRLRHWWRAKFDASVLKRELERVLGRQAVLGESHCRLLIPAYNVTADLLKTYRTPLRRNHQSDHNQSAVDAALASASAPTYFDPAAMKGTLADYQGVDGGVWANCPALAALAEAVGSLNIPLESIHMLSIGTTYSPALAGQVRFQGKAGWAAKVASFLLKAQAQATVDQAQRLLGERFLRIDHATGGAELDDLRAVPELANLGESDAAVHEKAVAMHFLNGVETVSWKLANV